MYKNTKKPAARRVFCCPELSRRQPVRMVSTKEEDMDLQMQAQNDAMNNKNMMDDPNWTAAERQKYQAAYTAAKQATQNGQ